jgi:hypothetical protein
VELARHRLPIFSVEAVWLPWLFLPIKVEEDGTFNTIRFGSKKP